ncbi:FmdB family zinc ribbon protein [Gemmatimonadota bacterium]
MPTYEYECLVKGHRFEEFQNMNDAPLTACPECGSGVRRLISGGAGFLFRGSGFYQTDYRSESYKKAEQAEQAAASGSVSSSSDSKSGSTDSKGGSSSTKNKSSGKKTTQGETAGGAK